MNLTTDEAVYLNYIRGQAGRDIPANPAGLFADPQNPKTPSIVIYRI